MCLFVFDMECGSVALAELELLGSVNLLAQPAQGLELHVCTTLLAPF